MARPCDYCGREIEFRYIDGICRPMHFDGAGWCNACGSRGNNGTIAYQYEDQDLCWPTQCPRCSRPVFLIRHQGGCAWLDGLVRPWPTHDCFRDQSSEQPFKKFRTMAPSFGEEILGLVVRLRASPEQPMQHTHLAIECASGRRFCAPVEGVQIDLLGQLVLVFADKSRVTMQRLATISGDRAIHNYWKCNTPSLGLSIGWLEEKQLAPLDSTKSRSAMLPPKIFNVVQGTPPSKKRKRRKR
jgi:hypothetical protein